MGVEIQALMTIVPIASTTFANTKSGRCAAILGGVGGGWMRAKRHLAQKVHMLEATRGCFSATKTHRLTVVNMVGSGILPSTSATFRNSHSPKAMHTPI